ncbi:MAG: hypothetical protein QM723_10375 [Myxococcaceae bacterium]
MKTIESPMHPTGAPDLTAPGGKARVIVARPHRGTAFRMAYHVIADGAYVGDTFDDTAFAIDVAPGSHQICAGNGPNVTANVEAGKTYLLRVDLTFTNVKATPVKKGTDDFKELMEGIHEIRGTQVTVPFTEDALKPAEVKEMANDCASSDKDLDGAGRQEQTLAANDAI